MYVHNIIYIYIKNREIDRLEIDVIEFNGNLVNQRQNKQ